MTARDRGPLLSAFRLRVALAHSFFSSGRSRDEKSLLWLYCSRRQISAKPRLAQESLSARELVGLRDFDSAYWHPQVNTWLRISDG
jgi:hypothetical protein